MTDAELRALVRDAVARHLAGRAAAAPPAPSLVHDALPAPAQAAWTQHPSHYTYVTVVNTTDACVIEPGVSCDHCGYCKSHGH
ncbi:MAG TPA: hypothetical protein VG736_04290 [Vicinamibacterales bacterium]|jgi:hypothetical protein|nr:hypothetical protein [Vicinamibacterales bacterium]